MARRWARAVGGWCVAFAVLLAGSRTASAADKTRFWVDAQPWTCVEHVAPFARQIQLACDAAGDRCAIASSEDRASRRAILRCGGARWELDVEDTATRARILTVDLAGARDERLRAGAVWVVRTVDGATPTPIPTAIPTATPTPTANAMPSDAGVGVRRRDDEGGIAADVGVGYAPLGGVDGSALSHVASLGAGLRAALDGGRAVSWLPRGTKLFVTAAGHTTLFLAYSQLTSARGGLGFGWGAPWTRDVLGFSVDAGVVTGKRHASATMDLRRYYGDAFLRAYGFPEERGATRAYASAAATAQVPFRSAVRPFVTGSIATPDGLSDGPVAALGLGCVWSAW